MSRSFPDAFERNFESLTDAGGNGNLMLLEARERATGKLVPLVCAVNFDGSEYEFVPYAVMIDGNPYELYDPPHPDGGFGDSPGTVTR